MRSPGAHAMRVLMSFTRPASGAYRCLNVTTTCSRRVRRDALQIASSNTYLGYDHSYVTALAPRRGMLDGHDFELGAALAQTAARPRRLVGALRA